MKLTTQRLKKMIKEELNKLLEMDNEPVTYSKVYPDNIGKILDMIVFSTRGESDYYETRIHILTLLDSLGEQFAERVLEILEKEIKEQHQYASYAPKSDFHEVSEPRYKLMDLEYDIKQMLEKGYEVAFQELKGKATESEDPNWLDV